MLDHIKVSIEKSQQSLDGIIEKLADQCEDLSEDAVDLWQQVKPKLESLKGSLVSAQKSLHTQTDETLLQAHLAKINARDFEHARKKLEPASRRVAKEMEKSLETIRNAWANTH